MKIGIALEYRSSALQQYHTAAVARTVLKAEWYNIWETFNNTAGRQDENTPLSASSANLLT